MGWDLLLALESQELLFAEEGEVGVEDVFAGPLEESVALLDFVEVVVVGLAFL